MSETPEYIQEFMDAVYEGYGALALSSFNEKLAIQDATKRIKAIEAELQRVRDALEWAATNCRGDVNAPCDEADCPIRNLGCCDRNALKGD